MNPASLMFGEEKNWINKKDIKPRRREFGLLISSAIVSKKFRNQLLSDPLNAIEKGYNNQPFFFSDLEKQRICSIIASSFREFSEKIYLIENDLEPINHVNSSMLVLS